ncbi:MAG: type II toxin-antitoxin system VapC family toxin, partial [Pontiellaceae bacterium]|nr:type II toxin-antitoxin system VapC family toxin [Pontiellaceae bacterium]
MRVLLDTHAFLWWISNSPFLSSAVRQVMADAENEIYLSAVSVWEMAIKARAGKLRVFSGGIETFVDQHVRENAFQPLPITLAHSAKVHALSNHHRDPF